jgi:hypothetical protein
MSHSCISACENRRAKGELLTSESELTAVRFILEKEWPDSTSSETVAKAAIKALDDLRSTTWRPIGPPVKVGEPFKSIITSKTHYVMWTGEYDGREYAWIVTADSDYGWFAPLPSPFWLWTVPSRVMQKTIDAAKVNELGMVVGDRIKLRQYNRFEVIAVFSGGVLMKDRDSGQICPESNGNIEKYYQDGWS